MNQTRPAGARGTRRKRRSVMVIMAFVMIVSVATEVGTAEPAEATTYLPGCTSNSPWEDDHDMTTSCSPGDMIGTSFDTIADRRSDDPVNGLLKPERVDLYESQGFDKNFLWYAPEFTFTMPASGGPSWAACRPEAPAVAVGEECAPADVIYKPMSPLVAPGAEFSAIGDQDSFIVLGCGNPSDGDPSPMTPYFDGVKFRDDDRDGARDAGEPTLAGWEIDIFRTQSFVGQSTSSTNPIATVTTGSNGMYQYDLVGQGPGVYLVRERMVAGWTNHTPIEFEERVGFGIGSAQFTNDFGNLPVPPSVTVDDHTLNEGETILMDGTVVTNPAGFALTYSWSPDDKLDDGTLLEPSFTGLDDAVDNITLTVSDPFGQSGSDVSRVTTLNLPPIPEIGEDFELDENDTFTRTGLTYTDAGVLDTHTGTVDYGDGTGPQPLTLTPTGPGTGTFDLSHQYLDDDPSGTPQDDYTITVTITDDDGGVGQDTMTVIVNNLDPTVQAGENAVIDEGDVFERELPFGDVGTLDTHTVTVDYGEGDGFEPVAIIPGTRSFLLSHLYEDDDPTATPQDDYTIRVRVEDDDVGVVEDEFVLTVNDVAPDLEITGPTFDGELFAAPATINLVAPFTDPGVRDTFECRIDWDEGPATLDPPEPETVFDAPFSGTTGNCDATNVFEQAGVYTIRVTVTDDDTLYDVEERMIVVYDPSAGFVTGGGYIDSPAGAYLPDPTLTGKATFGFVSKYKKNGTTPEGNTEFQFHAGDLNFHSGDYDWLVVTANGTRAQYKGTGTINGAGDYGFIMTVFDNGEPGSGVDQLRMKIWDRATDELIYDNRVGLSDDVDRADPQIITNGNIAIHTKGGGNR